jgi:hypothetical protein
MSWGEGGNGKRGEEEEATMIKMGEGGEAQTKK